MTLTVTYESDSEIAAPFRYIKSATIRNLHVAGSVTVANQRAAGLIGENSGTSAVVNCRVSAEISGRRLIGGFCIGTGDKLSFTRCIFNGRITGNPDQSGCFVAWGTSGLSVSDSVTAPQPGSAFTGGTFCHEGGGAPTLTNCYYTQAFGKAQGRQAHAVTAGEGVTLDFGEPKAVYPTSGITAYPTGLVYDGVFYAGPGETVSLMPGSAVPKGQYANYVTDAGSALRRGDRTWFLDVQDRNAVICAEFADLPAAFGAPDVILPSRLTAIGADAFAATAAKAVRVPDGCQSIGDHAFRDSGALREIRIPAGCALGENVFTGCPLVFVFGKAGSPAEEYCNSHVNTIFIAE